MTPLIRPFRHTDLAALQALEATLFGTDAWSPEVFAAEVSHPASHYLVLDDDGVIVGYGGLRSPAPGQPGDIQTLAIEPSYRGAGWGRSLLDALLAIAHECEVPEIFLEVRADNALALRLYERSGFREIGRRAGYYQPDGVDAIVMRRTSHDTEGAVR